MLQDQISSLTEKSKDGGCPVHVRFSEELWRLPSPKLRRSPCCSVYLRAAGAWRVEVGRRDQTVLGRKAGNTTIVWPPKIQQTQQYTAASMFALARAKH
jgi:hypothetical protein